MCALQDDPNFVEGNLKHSINGFVFCNMPPVSMGTHATGSGFLRSERPAASNVDPAYITQQQQHGKRGSS